MRIVKYAFVLLLLAVGGVAGFNKWSGKAAGNPEGMKIEVRNNKCKLISSEGKVLLELEVDGKTFTVVSTTMTYGANIQGNRVRVIDEDGTTVLCDMDYNGHVITVTNVHGFKVSEVDVNLKMDRRNGVLSGIKEF